MCLIKKIFGSMTSCSNLLWSSVMTDYKDKIALVGMACRLPNANSVNEFWSILIEGQCATKNVRVWPDKTTDISGFIDQPNAFDAAFFNVSPNEAQCMSPQLRQLLEVSYQAIESSGLSIETLKNLNTGVFCTGLPGDYKYLLAQNKQAAINPYSFSGNAYSALSGRLSYYYDFHGPSITLDTACSSGLTALHMAQLSIQNGDCEAALVGGASIFSTSEFHTLASASKMLSPSHECAAFDERADGFVASEGVVVLVLLSYKKAKELGLPIYGVIKNSLLNHNGLSNGIMAPNLKQQESLIKTCYQKAGLSLADIAFIETHGTATKLGDSIEMQSLSNVFANDLDKNSSFLGASKMIIGHCLVSSALASVIKLALAYYHQKIPPNPLFKTANPLLNFPDNISVNTDAVYWPKGKNYAGISAYGFTGSNGHLIMEFEKQAAPTTLHQYQNYYLLSAATNGSLLKSAKNLHRWLIDNPQANLDALSVRLMRKPKFLKYRAAIYAQNRQQLIQSLDDFVLLANEAIKHNTIDQNPQARTINLWLKGEINHFELEQVTLSHQIMPPYPFQSVDYHAEALAESQKNIPQSIVFDNCIEVLCDVLSYQVEQINEECSLVELGIDSLTALTLINKLKNRGFITSLDAVWNSKSIKEFAHTLVKLSLSTADLRVDIPDMIQTRHKDLTWLTSKKENPPIILLPPLNSDYKAWRRQIPILLANNYQVHTPFYPGHNATVFNTDFSLIQLAHQIADFALSLPQKPHFVGWSLGGVLSILAAVNNKNLMKSMTLISCATEFDESLFEKTMEMQQELNLNKDILQIAFQTQLPINEYISCKTPFTILKDYYKELIGLSVSREQLSTIAVSTQMIFGKQDPVINSRQIAHLQAIPHQTSTVIDNAGHFIPIILASRFNQLLISFFESVEQSEVLTDV